MGRFEGYLMLQPILGVTITASLQLPHHCGVIVISIDSCIFAQSSITIDIDMALLYKFKHKSISITIIYISYKTSR